MKPMKTQITRQTVRDIAALLAWHEVNELDALNYGAHSTAEYWRNKEYGIKEACNYFLGAWPAVYVVENVARPYVVVSFECLDPESEFHFDANTFDEIKPLA